MTFGAMAAWQAWLLLAGAAALAALLQYRAQFRDKLIAVPICGGNLTAEQIKELM